jgi:formylglycine-generating enzyme required for sulfatase activity
MIKLVQIICFLVSINSISAQSVSNVRVEQDLGKVVINYSLETATPCDISVFISTDNGNSWRSLTNSLNGDFGKNISGGERRIECNLINEKDISESDEFKFKITATIKKTYEPEMVFVEGGTFSMGSNFGDVDEKPIHVVTLDSYNIGKYEVTQAQWKAVMGNYTTNHKACDECPAHYASSKDVLDFISRLNSATGKNYRLPTEAEWEFAARGGNLSKGYRYSGSNDINEVAWFNANSEGNLHFVGTKQCNELGIYDMSGNVWEWCSDWYGEYSRKSQNNPMGPSLGNGRVLRGGGSAGLPNNCRATKRMSWNFERAESLAGFRLVLP